MIGAPPKDPSRKALEHITMLSLYDKLELYRHAGPKGTRASDLREIGTAIIDKYIEENKHELD